MGTKSDGSNVFAVLESEGKGLVTAQGIREPIASRSSVLESFTDFTKSNTETLLPTGLSTEFPSGVNIMFPCWYTVPHRFEN